MLNGTKVELVQRPRRTKYDYDALLSTMESGLAAKIPLAGRTPNGVRASLDQWLRRHHPQMRLRARLVRSDLLVWCEQ
jgi:hypothetical protein